MHPRLHTPLCDLVGIEVPIVQTGMGYVAGPRLVSATANAGGLGILASATMDFDQMRAALTEIKGRTQPTSTTASRCCSTTTSRSPASPRRPSST
jgi:NAD(P)H-dependent flavin oxidoreductase YrpB (nitropropane dioxygenase family)